MKKYKLDAEEKKLVKEIERGEWKPVTGKKGAVLKERLLVSAKNTVIRNKNINLRLSELDLREIKYNAAQKGLPYQTLVASLVHQYNNGRLREVA